MFTTGLKKTAKTTKIPSNNCENFEVMELDELYWFVGQKSHPETRENMYVITLISRAPRQIVGFDAAFDKSRERIQAIVDSAPWAKKYCTDGYLGYIDVVYPGEHVRNCRDKSDTHTVESINADLRHYIPILARKSRCFARKIETLRAVLDVFVCAYNKFGEAKLKYRVSTDHKPGNERKHLHNFRELPFSVLDFLWVSDWTHQKFVTA